MSIDFFVAVDGVVGDDAEVRRTRSTYVGGLHAALSTQRIRRYAIAAHSVSGSDALPALTRFRH